jgi:hypothetical protein
MAEEPFLPERLPMSQTTHRSMLVKIAIVIISIALLASLGWFLKSDWFWFSWDIVGAVLVAAGCIAEWMLLYQEEPEHSDRNKLLEKAWALVVAAGVTMDVFGLIYGIPEAIRLESHVEDLRSANSAMNTNLAALNNKTLELAHQYDLSTNALAEANARLASVRPIKERLLDWFSRFAPSALSQLKFVPPDNPPDKWVVFKMTNEQPAYFQFSSLMTEPGATNFCGFSKEPSNERFTSGGSVTIETTIMVNPALAK